MKIKPILVTILLICLANLSSAQSASHDFTPEDFFEEYKIESIESMNWIDSVTILSKVSYKATPATVGYKIYITHVDNENNSFKTIELETPAFYAMNMLMIKAIRLYGKIYILRSEKSRKTMQYFLDEVIESRSTIVVNNTAFFEGSVKDGFTSVFDFELMNGELLLTSMDQDFNGYYRHLAFAFFNSESFSLLSQYSHEIPSEYKIYNHYNFGSTIKMKTYGNKKFILYSYKHPKEKNNNSCLLYLHDSVLDTIETEGRLPQPIFFTMKEDYYVHIFDRENPGIKNSLYKINLEDLKLELLDSGEFPLSMINMEYESKSEPPNLFMKSMFNYTYDLIDGEKPEIKYMVIYSECYGVNGDIIVVKVNNGKIEWNQYIKRTYRSHRLSDSKPSLLEDGVLIIQNSEAKEAFDARGEFTLDEVKFVDGNSIDVEYLIDTRTGEFERYRVAD